jgi:nucleoside-diphosphate-sugar epimerase
MPTYSVSKIAQEGVARAAARVLGLPVTLARIVIAYGDVDGLPAHHLRAMLAGCPVEIRHDPNPYNPIHVADMTEQLEALLDAASVSATIVNWGGDEVVTSQEWCAYLGQLTGQPPNIVLRPQAGTSPGVVLDVTRRRAMTGPCAMSWRDGMKALVDRLSGPGPGPG